MLTTVAIKEKGRYYNVTSPVVFEPMEVDGKIVYIPQEELQTEECSPDAFDRTAAISDHLFAIKDVNLGYKTYDLAIYDITNSCALSFSNNVEFNQLGKFVYLIDNNKYSAKFYCPQLVGQTYLTAYAGHDDLSFTFAIKLYRNQLFIFKLNSSGYILTYRTSSQDKWFEFNPVECLPHIDSLQIFTGMDNEIYFVDFKKDITYDSHATTISTP